MEKIIIGTVCAVLLTAAGPAYIHINNAAAEAEIVYMNYTDSTVSAFQSSDEIAASRLLAQENIISRAVTQTEWVNAAEVTVLKPDNFDGSDYSDVCISVVLEINRQPEDTETDGIVHLITTSLEGVKTENISITDKAGNAL